MTKLLLCEYDEAELPYFTVEDSPEEFYNSYYFYRLRRDRPEAAPDFGIHDEAAPYFALHYDSEEFQECCRMKWRPPLTLLQLHACDGLICYNHSDKPESLYLWNLFIGKVKALPAPFRDLNNDHVHRSVFKLWFDSKANDYKILRINYTTKVCIVEVYSLATNSWKIITKKAPVTTSFLNNNRLAYMNGTFYWPAFRDYKWTLISLDVETGMFRETFTTWTAGKLFLIPSGDNDSLLVLGYEDKDCPSSGIMCDFEVYDHSLNKLYTVDNKDDCRISCLHQPLGFRNNGEVLVQNMCKGREIVSYSVETKEFKDFVPATSGGLLRAIPFGVSLALLNDADAIAI
ncbi:hypothetical protein ACET3Z_011185 [Daucus carota]